VRSARGRLLRQPLSAGRHRRDRRCRGGVTSLDGLFTLDVPPGALPSHTEVTVRRLAPSQLPERLAALDVAAAYDLTPEGLQFAAP
jgi:hypothetical protein